MDILKMKSDRAALAVQAKTAYAEVEAAMKAKDTAAETSGREKLNNILAEGKKLTADIEIAEQVGAMAAYLEPSGDPKAAGIVPAGGDGVDAQPYTGRKSKGYQFIETPQFKALAKGETRSARAELKAILGETAGSGGETIRADRQTEIVDLARKRPPSVIDLVNHQQTTLSSVDYVRMTGRTDTTAIVAEGAAKPEGDLAFDVVTATVKTIAEWMKASKQILDDAPRLRGMIDTELEYMLRLKLENVVIADMLAASGIQTRVHQVSGRAFSADDTIADTIRRAITDIRLEFYEADGVVMHPTQAEAMELDKGSDGHYTMVYDPVAQRVWRVRVIDTPAITSGTMAVANFLLAYTVWDRMQPATELGFVNDDFTKNLITLLGELRAAYGMVRPKAFEKITGA